MLQTHLTVYRKFLRAACVALCALLFCASAFALSSRACGAYSFDSVVVTGNLPSVGGAPVTDEPDGAQSPDLTQSSGDAFASDDAQNGGDAADAREISASPESGEVLGVTDEDPGGVSVFWAIVIALFVAGAVVFGIVLILPRDDVDDGGYA